MKRIDMIGAPLDHVRSPDLLNRMLRSRGEAVAVANRELRPAELEAYVVAARQDPDATGLIVTTPLKQAITAYLAERTALVSFLGASNCVRFEESGWIGANFDGHGFVAALAALGSGDLAGKRVLIVGCGGAGSAIAASLVESAGIALALHDVDRARAAAFAERLGAFAPASEIEAIDAPTGVFDLVVNASPIGMNRGDPSPIPEATVASATIVADIVTVGDTALKRTAAALGKPILTGDAMVAGQVSLLRRFLLGGARSEREVLSGEVDGS